MIRIADANAFATESEGHAIERSVCLSTRLIYYS